MKSHDILNHRLQNQLLIESPFDTAEETVKWMGAVQGQDYNPGLWAIGIRAKGMGKQDILQSLADLKIVRSWTMRHTIHFVTIEDVHWMVQLSKERMLKRYKNHMLKEVGLGESELNRGYDAIQKALEGKKLVTRPDLRQYLEAAGIDTSGQKYYHLLWFAAQSGLIFIGPMKDKQQTFGLIEEWAPKLESLSREEALQKLAARYLQSHGPATVKDFAWWSGLTQKEAKIGFELTGGQHFAMEETGVEYWYIENEKLINKTLPDTIHLIYSLDEYLIGYKDRTAAWSGELQAKLDPKRTGYVLPILFNGEVIGSWRPEVKKQELTMDCTIATTKDFPIELLYKEAERYSLFFDLDLIKVNVQNRHN